jgi:enoyl-CoA hydratase/carnithine racemase
MGDAVTSEQREVPTTDYEALSVDVDADGIAMITLDRPHVLNAFDAAMQRELIEVFDRTDGDDDVRAVVVTGRGRAFCAGADLSTGGDTFHYDARGGAYAAHHVNGVHRDGGGLVALRVFASLKPVIAAVNGPAVGVGASLQLPMDARLASHAARFGFVFSRRGMVPDAAASWFLPRLVGIPAALEWSFSGRVFSAQEALDAGLVQGLHEPDELLPAARALALAMVADSAPVSLALTRQLIWRMAGAPHPMVAHQVDSRALQARGASPDVQEGVTAFLEKRTAHFPQRVSTDLPDVWSSWEPPPFA